MEAAARGIEGLFEVWGGFRAVMIDVMSGNVRLLKASKVGPAWGSS